MQIKQGTEIPSPSCNILPFHSPEVEAGEKERKASKRMFFPFQKWLMLQEEDLWVAPPTRLVPLKTLVHPSGSSPQSPSKLLLVHQSPTQMSPPQGCVSQLPYNCSVLCIPVAFFLPISIKT